MLDKTILINNLIIAQEALKNAELELNKLFGGEGYDYNYCNSEWYLENGDILYIADKNGTFNEAARCGAYPRGQAEGLVLYVLVYDDYNSQYVILEERNRVYSPDQKAIIAEVEEELS